MRAWWQRRKEQREQQARHNPNRHRVFSAAAVADVVRATSVVCLLLTSLDHALYRLVFAGAPGRGLVPVVVSLL